VIEELLWWFADLWAIIVVALVGSTVIAWSASMFDYFKNNKGD